MSEHKALWAKSKDQEELIIKIRHLGFLCPEFFKRLNKKPLADLKAFIGDKKE